MGEAQLTGWGKSRAWRDFDGTRHRFTTSGHATREAAAVAWEAGARRAGYTSPRWWQFWRWGEAQA